jgi:hypothetical protein
MTSDSGLALIRSAVLVRAKKSHLANLARDLGTGLATLEEFAHGRAKLPNDILNALAKELFGANATYDPQIDKLIRAKPPTIPMGAHPRPFRKWA